MEIETRLMVALNENKINYEKKKIETQLDQINKSLTQIDINVQVMVRAIEVLKEGESFCVQDSSTYLSDLCSCFGFFMLLTLAI